MSAAGSDSSYDLVVIGSGPAGEKGAAQAAYFGKKVALVERRAELGGAGINTGTVPSKTLRETALYYSGLLQRGLYPISYSLRDGLTVADFLHRKDVVVANERNLVQVNLAKHGVDVVHGEASLIDANTIGVARADGRTVRLKAKTILIATGSTPYRDPQLPWDHPRLWDSDTVLEMPTLPGTMAVIGGGVIGCEYASIFGALGVKVTLIDGRDRLLGFADREIATRLEQHLVGLGLDLRFNHDVDHLEKHGEGLRVVLTDRHTLDVDAVLIAAGRRSKVEGLGLEEVGVKLGRRGLIEVDEQYRTAVPSIYAAGDVIGFPALASTSMEQARVAMVHAFGLGYKTHMASTLPLAVYTVPEIAMVGLSEEACVEQDQPYVVGRAYYSENARGQIIGDLSGMLKLLLDPRDSKLLGVHILGESAAELVHLGAAVIAQRGTVDAFIDCVFNYPTLSDLYKYAAYNGLGAQQTWRATREA